MMNQKQAVIFIDGFNLYHAIEKNPDLRPYKWCNLRTLSEIFCNEEERIRKVLYFTAYCSWNPQKKKRHKVYNRFLNHFGVDCVLGNYAKVSHTFNKEKMTTGEVIPPEALESKDAWPDLLEFFTHEEKQTDVNIAVKIVEMAFLDQYDHAYILSGDSDLVSAIKTVKRHFPTKEFTCVLPPKAKGKIMRKVCHDTYQITEKDLSTSLLPDEIVVHDEVLKKPKAYF